MPKRVGASLKVYGGGGGLGVGAEHRSEGGAADDRSEVRRLGGLGGTLLAPSQKERIQYERSFVSGWGSWVGAGGWFGCGCCDTEWSPMCCFGSIIRHVAE